MALISMKDLKSGGASSQGSGGLVTMGSLREKKKRNEGLMQSEADEQMQVGMQSYDPANEQQLLDQFQLEQQEQSFGPTKIQPALPGRDLPVIGPVLRGLDAVSDLKPLKAIAEYTVPDAPMLQSKGADTKFTDIFDGSKGLSDLITGSDGITVPGTNARQSFLQRNGMDPSEGLSKVVGQIVAPFAVPGAGLGAGTGLYKGAGQALDALAPKLGNTLGGRVAREAIREATVGAPLAAGVELSQGKSNLPDAAVSGAIGLGIGAGVGAAGPLIGRAIQGSRFGQALSDFFTQQKNQAVPNRSQTGVESELLSLPIPRPKPGEALPMPLNRGQAFADPIANPYTFQLPNASESTLRSIDNVNDGFSEITAINNQLRKLESDYQKAVNDQYQYLKESMDNRGGVTQGQLITDAEGKVIDRVGRISNNPQWYREFYAAVSRKPSNKELYELAKKHVDEGYQDESGFIPGWKQETSYDETVSSLNKALEQVRSSVKEKGLGITDAALKSSEMAIVPNFDDASKEIDFPFENVNVSKPNDVPNQKPVSTADDVLDDVEQIDPEEMDVPRLRDRINSYADELIAAAKRDMGPNRLSSNPADVYTKLAVGYMLKGAVKLADLTEAMVKDFGEEIRPRVKEIFKSAKEAYKMEKKRITKEEFGLSNIDFTEIKDFSGWKYNSSDVYRNFKDVFGKDYGKVKAAILDPLDEAKAQYVKMQDQWLSKLKTEVVDKLGITKGSELSAIVQDFGEGRLSLGDIKVRYPDKWEKIVAADKWFREAYDGLIDQVNVVRQMLYPTNPDKIVPKRQDYYRHYQELTGLSGLKNLFDTPSQIDPSLVGISEFLTPKSKFAGFMQKRGLGPYKRDAVGGFLNYLPSAAYSIHMDPQIGIFKRFAESIADATGDTKNLNNFIGYLQRYSQDLAGKTNVIDRSIQEYVPGGRKTMAVVNWMNNRVKSNVILGNVGSAFAQVANIPLGIAFAKQYSISGAGKTLQTALGKGTTPIEQSKFIRERFLDKQYRQFDIRMIDQPRRFASWMMETADRTGTYFIWNSAYTKAVKEGVADPVKYADENTRRLIAGRGIGEVPLMQKSKLFQLVAPFTLEVANLWRVQKDMIKEKDFAGLVLFFTASFLLNKGMEEVRGSDVTFDPIDAIIEASADDLTIPERGGRIAGEVISNIPLGSALASIYPEYGMKSPEFIRENLPFLPDELPTRKKLFGDNDPTRFGSGPLVLSALTDPLGKALLPFGGNQLTKTAKGIAAIAQDGAYSNGKLAYPIDVNPLNAVQMLAFGPAATDQGQNYYDNDGRPLSEEQTKMLKNSPDKKTLYANLMKQRGIEKIDRKMDEVVKDQDMTPESKRKALEQLMKKMQQQAAK